MINFVAIKTITEFIAGFTPVAIPKRKLKTYFKVKKLKATEIANPLN